MLVTDAQFWMDDDTGKDDVDLCHQVTLIA